MRIEGPLARSSIVAPKVMSRAIVDGVAAIDVLKIVIAPPEVTLCSHKKYVPA